MNELSLFTGAGGGLLGGLLLGFKTVGYVEYEKYCQKIILQRIKDGILDAAPIFGDIRRFIKEGYARAYQGMVDVITAGFPCQPFSTAGKGLAESDERNMWPATIRTISIIRPRFAFLENVPGLFAHQYIQRIFGDMAEIGYDCRWCPLSASDIGASHKRERIWFLVAESDNDGCGRLFRKTRLGKGGAQLREHIIGKSIENMANAKRIGQERTESKDGSRRGALLGGQGRGREKGVADTKNGRSWKTQERNKTRRLGGDGDLEKPECDRLEKQREARISGGQTNTITNSSWWDTEPDVGRMAHGVAHRVDRLKALGNGQVPAVVAAAWRILNNV